MPIEWQDKEYCGRCSAELQASSRSRSLADGRYYCAKCAAITEQERLARTTCSVCRKALARQERKIVMPSSAYGESSRPISLRLLCITCYRNVATKMPGKMKTMRPASMRHGFRRMSGRLVARAYA